MKKFAIYGKGGIGKSTVTSSLSAAFSLLGYRVMQIGCDPKADSTSNLLGSQHVISVMDYLREQETYPSLNDIVQIGYNGIYCIEPVARLPVSAVPEEELQQLLICLRNWMPSISSTQTLFCMMYWRCLYVVGFATPIRSGYAEKVLIVTSGEKMSLFAAQNIYHCYYEFSGLWLCFCSRNHPESKKYSV